MSESTATAATKPIVVHLPRNPIGPTEARNRFFNAIDVAARHGHAGDLTIDGSIATSIHPGAMYQLLEEATANDFHTVRLVGFGHAEINQFVHAAFDYGITIVTASDDLSGAERRLADSTELLASSLEAVDLARKLAEVAERNVAAMKDQVAKGRAEVQRIREQKGASTTV